MLLVFRFLLSRCLPGAFLLFCLLLLLNLHGCTKQIPPPHEGINAPRAWTLFREGKNFLPAFKVKTSISYTDERQSRRVVLTAWGNFDYPIRADLQAGIGANLIFWREDSLHRLAFYPSENTAITLSTQGSTLSPGLDIPFSFQELAAVLTASWDGITPPEYQRAERAAQGGWRYFLDDERIRSVVLDQSGRPLIIQGGTGISWEIHFDRWTEADMGRAVPQKLTLTLETGERVVLYVKTTELYDSPWDRNSTSLPLPEDVQTRRYPQ